MAIQYPLVGAPSYALTKGPQVYRVFTPSSQVDLMERIVSALLAAYHVDAQPYGFSFVSDITRGHRLKLVSPQFFEAYLDVYWYAEGAGRNPVLLTWSSSTGSGAVGFEQRVNFQDGLQYQIVCNPAGYFISRPGVVADISGSTCCGGIPFVDSGCGFGADAISEIWFQFSDFIGGFLSVFYHNFTPRKGLDYGGGGTGGGVIGAGQQGNYNGTVISGNGAYRTGPQILRVSSAGLDGPSHALWYDGLPILYPAFVGWNDAVVDAAGDPLKIRGQVYDAVVRSKPYAMDLTASWDTFDWINFTADYFFGSLWLITGAATGGPGGAIPVLNVAY